jgi:hypothetical protein
MDSEMRQLMIAMPANFRQRAVWRYIAELLTETANDRASVDEVAEMLVSGLKIDGEI